MRPSWERVHATPFTMPRWPRKRRTRSPVCGSHSTRVWSAEPDTRSVRDSYSHHATQVTAPLWPRSRPRLRCSPNVSHSETVWSADAAAMRSPSRENRTSRISAVCASVSAMTGAARLLVRSVRGASAPRSSPGRMRFTSWPSLGAGGPLRLSSVVVIAAQRQATKKRRLADKTPVFGSPPQPCRHQRGRLRPSTSGAVR